MTDQNNLHQIASHGQITRRDLIELAFVGTPVLTNMQRERFSPFMAEEFLSEATASLTACWHLLRGNGLMIVERAVPQYLPLLEGLVKHSSLYQQRAAYLAAQGYLLLELIAGHRLRFAERVTYCEKAVEYAQEAGDLALLVESLRTLGGAFRDTGQYAKMLENYQQAEHKSKKISGFLQSKVLGKLSLGYAQQVNSQEVTRCVGEAQTLFTEADDQTPVFLSASYGFDQIILDGGRSILALGNHAQKQGDADLAQKYWNGAAKQFDKIKQLPSSILVPKRIEVEFETNSAFVYAKLENMEAFITHFLAGLQGANELGSEKRKKEAIDSLIVAIHRWSHETRVTGLVELLR